MLKSHGEDVENADNCEESNNDNDSSDNTESWTYPLDSVEISNHDYTDNSVPSISIVLHNTATGSSRKSFHGTINCRKKPISRCPSSSLLDNCHHNLECGGSTRTSSITHSLPQTVQGQESEEDAFVNEDDEIISPSSTSQPLNLTSFSTKISSWWYVLTFNISIWVGVWCVWKLYLLSKEYDKKSSSSAPVLAMLSRLLGILAAIVACIAISFMMNILQACYYYYKGGTAGTDSMMTRNGENRNTSRSKAKYSTVQSPEDDKNDDQYYDLENKESLKSPGMITNRPSEDIRKLFTMTTKQYDGQRPSIPTLLEDEFKIRKEKSEDVTSQKAIFLCGPKGLVNDVKSFLPYITDPSSITIHEELFEY